MKLYFSNTKPPHAASRIVGSYEYFLLLVYEKKIVLLSEKMAFWKGKRGEEAHYINIEISFCFLLPRNSSSESILFT
jgi:hypothetical protein